MIASHKTDGALGFGCNINWMLFHDLTYIRYYLGSMNIIVLNSSPAVIWIVQTGEHLNISFFGVNTWLLLRFQKDHLLQPFAFSR